MSRQKVISAAEAARLIPDDAIVTVSSSSGLGCPEAVLKAVGERFDSEGHPRNITTPRLWHSATIAFASARVSANGFSQRTCLPAAATAKT